MSKKLRFAVIIERGENNYSAYSPDLPGCVTTGKTPKETLAKMRDAMEFHLEGLRSEGQAIPIPKSIADYITI
jgi:predicted RNase H-like HicB family nuclease